MFGDNVRCNGNLEQFITGLKKFERHPVCESADMLTTYSLTTKAFCDATYAPIKTISGFVYTFMDLESNQTAWCRVGMAGTDLQLWQNILFVP